MNAKLQRLLRSAVVTDSQATFSDGVWRTRCLHCRTTLLLSNEGESLNGATLEHIVPRSWFAKRAARDLTAAFDGADDARNLALACARCNQGKGSGPDAAGPNDPRAREIVTRLLAKRAERWIEPVDR